MKLGIRGHDIINGKTSAAVLKDTLIASGMDTVQLVCHKSIEHVEYEQGGLTADEAQAIGCAFSGFHIALLGAYFNPVHPNSAVVDTGIGVFKDVLARAAVIGCGVVASETGSYQGDPWSFHPKNRAPEALSEVIKVFGGLAEFAKEQGVCIGIEGAAGHVCHDVQALKHVTNGIGADNVRIVFDYFNFMDGEHTDCIQILDEGLSAFPDIHCFHVKDCMQGSLEQVPVGKGDMDFKRILSMIKQYDNNAVLILEGTPASEAERSSAFLRDIWRSV